MKNILILLLVLFSFSPNPITFAQRKSIDALEISDEIETDGVLNESVWNKAIPVSDFLQQEPIRRASPTYRTEAKVLYNKKSLFVGIMCYDDEPEKLVGRELRRDGSISSDDNIKIIFDTFDEKRSSYFFAVNILGAVNDALMNNQGYRGFNEDWDGIWTAKTQILENGWSVEIEIPFSTMKFYNIENQVWGINFLRSIRRLSEVNLWTSVGENLGFFNLTELGKLKGIKNVKRGDPIYLMPFITAGAQVIKDEKNEYVHEPGLDIKYGVTETLSLDVTANTDFAQVESDRERINLSRFPLFFPEKRDFFIEGAKVFDFRLGGRDQVFYSRRIGLEDGNEIPIIGGAKLVGRVSEFELGVLSMQTANKDDALSTNYSAARVKYDILDQSYAGIIFTNKVNSHKANNVIGADVGLRFTNFLSDKNFNISANLTKSFEKNNAPNSFAGRFEIAYPNDLISTNLIYTFIQNNYNPEIGFIRRRGVHRVDYSFRLNPRVNWHGIKVLQFVPLSTSLNMDKENKLIGAGFYFKPIGIRTIEGDNFSVNLNRSMDKVNEDFDIFDEHTIKQGEYWFNRISVNAHSSYSRPISGGLSAATGDFYTGNRKSFSASFNLLPSKHITISGDYSYNNISLNNGSFSTNELSSRFKYDFSTQVNTSIFTQWNNELKKVFLNYRFNWKPKPGSDVYLVLNQQLDTDGGIRSERFAILAKVVWMFII